MARMKLHKNTRFGDNEVYPIYDIDFSGLSSTGYVQEESNDAVGSQAYKYRQWKTINNNIGLYIPRNIPKIETQEGNIIPFWHRYNNLIDDSYHGVVQERYTMPTENLESYAAVQLGVKPDDWGTNPNYIELLRETWIGHDVIRPYTNRTISTWSSTTSYYEDTKRTELRMFFTDAGCSFTCTKMSYSRGDGSYMWPRTYSIGLYPYPSSSLRFPANYAYTDPEGHVIDDDYYINDTISVISPGTGYADWSNYTDGYNCQMVFVHYVQNGTDFYGVAIIQMNNFTEQSEPVAIHVSAWDKTFWGTSIIAGGGGSGPWTNDGPTSYVQGGQGRFSAPSDSRGDRSGSKAESIKDKWNDAETSLMTTGYNRYVLGVDNTIGVDDTGAFGQFCQQLWAPDVWDSITNKYYNPISSILVSHMMPKELAPPLTTGQATRDHIYAAQTILTPDFTVSRFLRKNISKHIGDINISNYTDSFADYTNTAIYIHLPYVGTYQLDISACMGGWLSVDYLVDVFSGDITALITTCDKDGNSQLRYSWKGNCAKDIPLQQRVGPSAGIAIGLANTAAMAAISVPMAIASGVGEVMTAGNLTVGEALKATWDNRGDMFPSLGKDVAKMAGASVMTGIGNAAQSALQSSLITTSSNAEGGSLTSPIDTQCWVLISRPQWSAPDEYGKLFGYPSDIGGTINQSDTEAGDPFTNFLSVRSIKLDNIAATNEEKAEIYNLMTAGVFTTNN